MPPVGGPERIFQHGVDRESDPDWATTTRGNIWSTDEALRVLAEIGPPLRDLGAEVTWPGPPRWRRGGPELEVTVCPRRRNALAGVRQAAPTSEDLCDALQMLGWNPLAVADRGAGSLYVDRHGRRMRVHYRSSPP